MILGRSSGPAVRWVLAGLAVGCVVILVLFVSAFTVRGDRGPGPKGRNINAPTSLATVVDEREARQSIGAIVFLNDVQLTPGPADNIFLARDNGGREVVVRSSGARARVVKSGIVADVTGTIALLPPAGKLHKEWKFPRQQAERLRNQLVFIEAEMIKPERQADSDSAGKEDQ